MTTAFLVGTGVVAGIIAAMVGGAAVVIYPALIATGVSPQLAAVSNLASVMPATMLAALSDRSQLPPFNRAFVGLIVASVIGAGVGAVLLLLDAGADVRANRAAVDRVCHAAVRLFRTDQPLAARARRGPRSCHHIQSSPA